MLRTAHGVARKTERVSASHRAREMPQKTQSLPRVFTKEDPSMSVDATELIGILAVRLGAASISTAAFLIAAVLGLSLIHISSAPANRVPMFWQRATPTASP